jgi:uncharacterized protein with HEPN domain
VREVDLDGFVTNTEKVYAVTRALEIIGEAARHIPGDLQAQYTEVPWADMIGMRNIVIHGYFAVDNQVIWRTVQDDLPSLVPMIEQIIDSLGNAPEGIEN